MDNTEIVMNGPSAAYDFFGEVFGVFDYSLIGKTRIIEDTKNEQVTEIINTGQLNKTEIIKDIEINNIENEQVNEINNIENEQVKTRSSEKY